MRRERGTKPEINVTPLVDVVLVLLIIFMVVTPQLEEAIRVELPGAAHADAAAKGALTPLTLVIGADGALLFDDKHLAAGEIGPALTEAHERDPSRWLVLKGDRSVPYGQVRRLFALGQDAGFPGVALVAAEPAKAESDAALGDSAGGP